MKPTSEKYTEEHRSPRPPQRLPLGLLIVAALLIIISLYAERVSRNWVPDADKKVKAAASQVSEQTFKDLGIAATASINDAHAQTEYAQALISRNNFFAAMLPAERAVAVAPSSSDAHLMLALIYSTVGYRERAISAYREALKNAMPESRLMVMQKLGEYLQSTGDTSGAQTIFMAARNAYPGSPGPIMSLASIYLDSGKASDALALLDPICTDPKTAAVGALYLNGKACQSLGKTTRAAELLRAAISRQSDFSDAYHTLGSILCNQARQQEGIPLLENAVKLNPNSGAIMYSLASAYFNDVTRQDHLSLARTTFEATLDRDPQNEWAHYYYGLTLEQQSNFAAAIREYERTLEINPDFDSALYRKAAVLTQLGKRDEAKACYALFDKRSKHEITSVHDKRRNNSIVDTAEEHYRRGMALMQKGDRDAARDDFKIALQREPGNAAARRALQGVGGL